MRKALFLTVALALLCLAVAAQADVFNLGPGIRSLEMVTVGDPRNAADTLVMSDGTSGYGSVAYTYKIGKYNVTSAQYCDFLNHVAKTDTYGLYSAVMTSFYDGITRTGSSGSYSYSVPSYCADYPVIGASFWDACRFANWIQNGQPTGSQGAGTTETGAYTLTADGISNNTVTRNPGTTWAVTSENEWYKAAYYKGGGTDAGYWKYATQSDSISHSTANYGLGYGDNSPSLVGFFPYTSAYGTYDQSGNVYEWNESILQGSWARGIRGGSWHNTDVSYLAASNRNSTSPTFILVNVGFRISQIPVPEPSSIAAVLFGLSGIGAMALRKRGSQL